MSEKNLRISSSSQGFGYWTSRPYISGTRRDKLKEANLLIVPYESIDNAREPLFSSAARDLLDLFTGQDSSLVPDIAIDEDGYAELVLHGKLLDLGRVVALATVVPIAMNLVSNYVQKTMDGDGRDSVRFEMIFVGPDGTSSSVKYDGPASTFEKVFAERVRNISGATASSVAACTRSLHSTLDGTAGLAAKSGPDSPAPSPIQPPLHQEAIVDSDWDDLSDRRKNGKNRDR